MANQVIVTNTGNVQVALTPSPNVQVQISRAAIGTVSNVPTANFANYAANVTASNQPNITTVGTLGNLIVSGNTTLNNLTVTGNFVANVNVNTANYANFANIANIANSVSVANVSGIGNIAVINLDGSSSNVLFGNGVFAPESTSIANANYANFAGTAFNVSGSNVNGAVNLANFATTANAVAGANVSGTVANANFASYSEQANNANLSTFATTANAVAGANVSGQVANALVAGTVYTNAQPNITSVGTLTTLTSSGNITAPYFLGNVIGNISGNLVVPGTNTSVLFNQQGNAGASDAFQFNYATNVATITGNLSANYISGDGSGLSNIAGANITGVVANANYSAYAGQANTANLATFATTANAVAGANVSGEVANANYSAYANIAATANSVAVANVSGIGNIATVNLDGNASNILFGNGTFSAIPVVSNVANANYANFAGTAYSVSGANVSGEVANANYATYSGTAGTANSVAGANVSGTVANATYATNAGTAYSVSGANVSGEVANANFASYSNIASTANSVAVANVSGIGNIATTNYDGNASNILYGNGGFFALPIISNVGNANYANFAGEAFNVSASNITGTVANANYSAYAGQANTANLATFATTANAVAGANVSGEVANANYASYANLASTANLATYATTANSVALANVSGAGNIASLNIDGNASNILFGNGVFSAIPVVSNVANANYANFAGTAYSVSGANVSGEVANANFASYANLASTANLATYATTANAVAGANVSGVVANANYSAYANIAATANSVAVANVSGIGNIATTNYDGNASNILYGNGGFFALPVISNVANANFAAYAGNVTVNAQANITSVGTLSSLSVTGNIQGGNILSSTFQAVNSAGGALKNAIGASQLQWGAGGGNNLTVDVNININPANGQVDISPTGNGGHVHIKPTGNNSVEIAPTTAGVINNMIIGNVTPQAANVTTLGASGNITGANANLGNLVIANYFSGDGGLLSNITSTTGNANYANFAGTAFSVSGSNVSGTVANANYSAYANIAATANSVAVANVSGIGNIATINLDGNVSNLLTGNGTFVAIPTTSPNANFANFAGNVTVSSQPNITSTGNLISLNIDNGVAGSPTKQFQPNGISIGSTANVNLMANSSFVDIDYGNGQGGGNVLLGKTSTYLKARGNASSLTAANVSDRVGRTNYMFYNGNANVLAAATHVNPGAGVTFNTNANAITTAGQYAIITGNPSGDQANANALSNQNLYTFDPFGRIQITQGAAGSTSVALLINTYGGAGGNAAAGAQSIFFQRARGNRDGNLSVQPNDQLGGLNFAGHNGTGYFSTRTAGITAIVDSTYVANTANIPAGLRFQTTDNTTTYTTTFSANGSASFPGSLSTANGVTVVMNNISTVSASFAFSTYNNANSLVNPYSFFRARGNLATPAAAQVNDTVSSVGYNIYADAGNTYSSVASTGVTVSENDGAGNVAATYNVTAKTITLTGNVSGNSFTTSGILSASGNSNIANLQLNRFQENVFAIGSTSGTITPDFNNGSIQSMTLTGNITMDTLANAIAGRSMTLIITQDATGNRLLTSTMKFAGGSNTLSTAASSVDIISVFYDGTTYYSALTKGYA